MSSESKEEERKAKQRAYREAHRQELRDKNKVYRETHKKEIKAKGRANYEAYVERIGREEYNKRACKNRWKPAPTKKVEKEII